MPVSPPVQTAVAAAHINFFATDLLMNDPEALLLIAVTKDFEDEESGFIYISLSRALRQKSRRI